MFFSSRLTALLLIAACAPVSQNAMARDAGAGRYTMHQADNGFLRLDTQTGAVAYCRKNENWTCLPVEGVSSLERKKIARLEQENSELRKTIKELENMPVMPGQDGKPPGSARPGAGMSNFRLPSEQEIDKALDYFENMLRKFQERLKRLERDKPNKDDSKEL